MKVDEEDYLAHYGILRRSGRYEWGSSNNVGTRSKDFLGYVQEMTGRGLTEKEIAQGVGWTTTQLREAKTVARNQRKQSDIRMAEKLRAKGYSNSAIGQRMAVDGNPVPESTIRSWLAPGAKDRADILTSTSEMLRDQVKEKGIIDIGKGNEHLIGITYTKLKAAVSMLKEEGYTVDKVKITQQGTGHQTEIKFLAAPGTTQKQVWQDPSQIKLITGTTNDGGRSWFGLLPPLAINPKRVAVAYKEDGGAEADGVIFVRPGVKDVSLGEASYAQVRVQVGKGHYLKGMAMYSNDLPDGVDLLFNTNKSKAKVSADTDAMKELTDDPDNPFGAVIKSGGQQFRTKRDGTNVVTSVMNIVNEEGDWKDWSKNLSSQMLSKQSPRLVRSQLTLTQEEKKKEFDEINALTNPTIKQKLLQSFADDVDSSAVHLKAAALTRKQAYHVILPVNSLSETEVYAPNYPSGTKVVLIRHPHGGTFEIPELVVNNNHAEAKAVLGQARDAIGINSKVAERLSGADFDGDAVIVIPDNEGKIKSTAALAALKDFDPRATYQVDDPPKINTQLEMGGISNLITDMTLQAAPVSDIARAVKHSMVVIDAEKHGLDYKASALDNGIRSLKERYQGSPTGGAKTLISRASADKFVNKRIDRRASEGGPIDPKTGERRFTETNEMRTNKKGEEIPRQEKSKRLAETTDAFTLIDGDGTPVERIYADHSNKLKAMANDARKELLRTKPLPYSPSAATAYKKQVSSLVARLKIAERNSPFERQAQVVAGSIIRAKMQDNPGMDDEVKKRIRYQALTEARTRTGAGKERIVIADDEWDAIQAGAISPSRLSSILDNADLDRVKELATPRQRLVVTPAKLARAQSMLGSGYTRAEVAAALGIPLGTLDDALYS